MFASDRSQVQQVAAAVDAAHARFSDAGRDLLASIALADRAEAWRGDGARDTAHWLTMRLGISFWKAQRWIASAHALEHLPRLDEAFSRGELGIDKVVELTRFATPETEAGLIAWALTVPPGAIRHRGDLARRASVRETVDADRDRTLQTWYSEDGTRFGAHLETPAAAGPIVEKALERTMAQVPELPGEEGPVHVSARRADAFVALCSARVAADPDPDRATVVIHAQLEGLAVGDGGCEVEGGPVLHPQTVRRLLCNARVQTVVEDSAGTALGLGRLTREPPAWMVRQVRYRDRGCRFPGCGARAFTEAHHVRWWRHGGTTDLQNLLLICSFHHKLVHEHGWSVKRDADGQFRWRRPDGTRYRAGPSPGEAAVLSRSS